MLLKLYFHEKSVSKPLTWYNNIGIRFLSLTKSSILEAVSQQENKQTNRQEVFQLTNQSLGQLKKGAF